MTDEKLRVIAMRHLGKTGVVTFDDRIIAAMREACEAQVKEVISWSYYNRTGQGITKEYLEDQFLRYQQFSTPQ